MNTGRVLFSNNGSSRLFATVDGVSTSVRVEAGDGAKFPQPVGDGSNWFMVTLEDRRNNTIEICKCIGRSGDILNVQRAQEGTTAKIFAAGSNVSNRLTVGTMETFFQFNGYSMAESDAKFVDVTGDTMTGPLVLPAAPTLDNQAATKKYVDDVSIDEAPTDSRAYARQNLGWIPVGVGMPEAPTDGKIYGRRSTAWVETIDKITYDGGVSNVNNAFAAVNARVDANDTNDATQASQITSLQTANTTQDSQIAANNTKNIEQDNRLLTLEGTDASYGTRLSSIETKNTAQDGRLTAIEGVNTTQGTAITANATAITTEATTRAANDNAEATTRANADTALDGRVTTEKNRNDTQDTAIALRITDAPNDGGQYVRKNLNWALVSVPPGTIVADTAPASPAANQMWLKSSTGVLYIFYADPNSSQWIAVGASPQQVDQGYTRKTARARNRVNNPTAQVSQENGNTAVTTSGAYPADQWVLNFSGIVSASQRVNTLVSPEGSNTGVTIAATTAKASLAAGDYLVLRLPIEGLDAADLQWGTANAKPVVLRFNAYCEQAGTFPFSLSNSAGNRTFLGSYTVAAAGWQTVSVAIPGSTAGTWPQDNTIGLLLRFGFAVGSTYVGVAGWQAGDLLSLPGMTNGAAIANSRLMITDVGLHLDPEATGVAPAFSPPPYEDDLLRCMRYWAKTSLTERGYGVAGTPFGGRMAFTSIMRVSPTLAYSGVSATNCSGLNFTEVSTSGFSTSTSVTAIGNYYLNADAAANARMI